MSKDLEQKQEHVSENPETTITQDTERATSSEVEKTTELPPEESKPCEEEITPHEKQTEKSDGTVKSIEEKSEPEIDVTEVYIDMSKIEFDEEGIPVFNDNDKARLKTSDIVFNNFELEIEDAKEAIRNARKELDIESQNSREENAKNGIKEATAKLEEISKLSEDEITEEIKNEKSQLEGAVDLYKTIIETLPKNNEKIKKELEKRIENSIKYIATYQNVSRVNLQKLQNDGTIAALISSTANTAFAQAFIDSIRKSKGQTTIDEDPEIKKISDEINKIKMDYEFKKMLFNAYTELGEVKLDFIIKHAKELADPEHVAEAEVAEAIDYKKLKEIPYIIESINPISNGNEDEANKKYEEVRTSLISVEENELDNIKEARRIETEYLDEMTKFKNAVFVLNEFGARPNKIPVISCNILKYSDPEEINKFRDNLKEKITTDWNTISEKYDSLEDKLEETKESLITSLKTFVKKNGLFSSFVSYAFANSETRGYYGRSESLLDFSHEDIFGNRYYDCIKAIMKNDSEEEYNHVKTNVNSVSMMLNNIIKYFVDLKMNTVEIEWANNFDPESVLKNFYFENKEKLDPFIEEYIGTIKVLSHVLCHNIKFKNKYNKFISDIIDFINENQGRIDRINDGKKVKDKYCFMTRIAFAYQFTTSYKKFIDEFEPINEEVTKKREAEKDITFEEFDKWYKENLLPRELRATSSVISSFLHMILGCNIIYAFDEFIEYFESKNKNKYLKEDCFNYLFNEYILESLAFRNCPKDKSYADYIKERSKHVAFQSLDYTFQKDVDPDKSRLEIISYIFGYATNCFKDVITLTCSNDKEDTTSTTTEDEKVETKKVKKSKEELIKEYRAKTKEKKKMLGNFKNSIKEYKNLINNLKTDNTLIQTSDANNIYDISVYSSKDTKVLVRIDRYAKDIKEEDVKRIFDSAIINPKEPISIDKAYVAAKKIPNDALTNINEKWYYNQYIDGSLVKRVTDGALLTTINPNEYTISERYRNDIYVCLRNAQDKIINSAIEIIKKTGVDFTGKTIAVKNNCKFDIKYFKPNNSPNFFDGNLNFFKAGLWDVITIELNYDIVNKKK